MLNEIADQHDKINAFHFGDFLEAISSDAVTYPLMVATPTPANMSFKKYNVSLDIVLADKYIEDNIEMRNGVLSDMMLISSDIRALFRQPEYDDFDIAETINVNPFVNKGGDLTCGVIMTVQLRVDDLMDFCIVPTNGTPSPTPSCDDAELVINETETISIPSGDTFALTVTLDGVEAGTYNEATDTWEVTATPCEPIRVTFDNNLIEETSTDLNIDCSTKINVVIVTDAIASSLNDTYKYNGLVNGFPSYVVGIKELYYDGAFWLLTDGLTGIQAIQTEFYPYLDNWMGDAVLTQGTISDYCSTPCAAATYTIKDSAATTLYSGSIAAGGNLNQTITDSTIEINDTPFQSLVAQGFTNIPVYNTESTQLGSDNGGVWEIPDTTYNIYVNGVLDQTVSVPTLKNETINITP